MGLIVTFYREEDAVVDCLPRKGIVRVCGEVVGTFTVPPLGKTKLPDVGLLVNGRTGNKMKITIFKNYVKEWSGWREAMIMAKQHR